VSTSLTSRLCSMAGMWTRDGSRAFWMGRAIKAGRVWTN
jgi:acyl-CoA reductase-like NAD-dependent aldehyde dehydrogenase